MKHPVPNYADEPESVRLLAQLRLASDECARLRRTVQKLRSLNEMTYVREQEMHAAIRSLTRECDELISKLRRYRVP